jgi:carbonic anhydrase
MSTAVQTPATQSRATPESTLQWLRAGNDRFVAAEPADRDLLAQVRATAEGQHPLAAIVGCIDSRVPPEIVFDLGIGDVFALRSAGNVVDEDMLGGLEFAAEVTGVKAIVVLGHTACGAVKGACDGVELGHLTGLLAKIKPAVQATAGSGPNPGSGDAAFVDRVVERNVRDVAVAITARSDVLDALVERGELATAGAVYDVRTGRADWLDL